MSVAIAQRLIEYVDSPHHIDPMSEAFKNLIRDASAALSEADRREVEATSRAHAEESTATRYANEIIELRAELAKTSALLVVQADRAEAAEVQVDDLHREIDDYRALLVASAQVADRAAEEFLSDAKAWESEKMPAAASQAKAQAKAAEMVAERIRALQSEER